VLLRPDGAVEVLPIFTVGHSNRSLEEFVAILQNAGIELVADVRTVPRSRANPQFNGDTLPNSLEAFGIGYQRFAELGGLRGRSKEIPPEVNGSWYNASFHNYADYAMSAAFAAELDQLMAAAEAKSTAIMCAEAVWWRCHRRIIADYLLVRGRTVLHLMGNDRVETASLTPAAELRDGVLIYPG
jgi:uncharacterized protein (DUF488 family)